MGYQRESHQADQGSDVQRRQGKVVMIVFRKGSGFIENEFTFNSSRCDRWITSVAKELHCGKILVKIDLLKQSLKEVFVFFVFLVFSVFLVKTKSLLVSESLLTLSLSLAFFHQSTKFSPNTFSLSFKPVLL